MKGVLGRATHFTFNKGSGDTGLLVKLHAQKAKPSHSGGTTIMLLLFIYAIHPSAQG
jgi:hypothetical protein